jgi:protein gp37
MQTKIADIEVRAPFKDLFPVDPVTLAAINESIQERGFDGSKPLDLWGQVLVDGHTRLRAAVACGLETVETFGHEFADEDAALEYAIKNQRDRRNMTAGDILRCVAALDQRKQRGGDRKSEEAKSKVSGDTIDSGPTAEHTAELLGVSPATVNRARAVNDHASQATKQAVETGELSLTAAAEKTRAEKKEAQPQEPKRASKPTFNKTNDNIEWAQWTWNPVTGCKHGCPYCYARDIDARFNPGNNFAPTFHNDRLSAPQHMRVPAEAAANIGLRNVFVCSMADLFGDWVPANWIDQVLDEVHNAPDWNFLFLTKNPKRLPEWSWPQNAWVGTTVDVQARVQAAMDAFREVDAPVRFMSCEPMTERLVFDDLSMFDWVILGGMSDNSGGPTTQPEWAWVEELTGQAEASGAAVYWKPNLQKAWELEFGKRRKRNYPEG